MLKHTLKQRDNSLYNIIGEYIKNIINKMAESKRFELLTPITESNNLANCFHKPSSDNFPKIVKISYSDILKMAGKSGFEPEFFG